jgi:hypothetical protein
MGYIQHGRLGRAWSRRLSDQVWAHYTPPEGSGTYEDFTGYTAVDPDVVYTVAQNKVTATNMILRDNETYLYKDFGAGYFTNGTVVNFEVLMSTLPNASGNGWMVALSNVLKGWRNSAQAVGAQIDYSYTNPLTKHEIWTDARNYAGSYLAVPYNTLYYCTFTFTYASPSIVHTYVYSDVARSNLIVNLSRPDIVQAKVDAGYQYLLVCTNYGEMNDVEHTATWYVQNVEIISH